MGWPVRCRRGRPLELSLRNLHELRQLWTTQRLSSLVARTLDRGNADWLGAAT